MKNLVSLVLCSGLLCLFLASESTFAKTVKYNLEITNNKMTVVTEEVDFALQVNGGIPGPVLEFDEGDDAEIEVKNLTNQTTSIHWHGVLVPWAMDGVPYVNFVPIEPGQSFTYKFTLKHSGTFWYHSHSFLQEQRGVYGAFVINPKVASPHQEDFDEVVLLSDWSNENPKNILKNLKKDGDYYALEKGSVVSLWGAIKNGAVGRFFSNEWKRMGGMDFSDVAYDAFLSNGKSVDNFSSPKAGDKVRLRIINGSGSSYFKVKLADLPFKVISADGVDVEPLEVTEFLIGVAETFDILFELPEDKSYELLSTAQDGTGSSSYFIGSGPQVKAAPLPRPNLYNGMNHSGMNHGGGMNNNNNPTPNDPNSSGHDQNEKEKSEENQEQHEGHQEDKTQGENEMEENQHNGHGNNNGMGNMPVGGNNTPPSMILNRNNLKSLAPTTLPANANVQEFVLNLTGDMERYVWAINDKILSESRNINIKKGDIIRLVLNNKTMMHHPMHLHGHFFRVLNGQGNFAPLKHTIDVPPMATQIIEFFAGEDGEWFFHCHNLFHMKTGMARVVSYVGFVRPQDLVTAENKANPYKDPWYYRGDYGLFSSRADIFQRWSNTRNGLEIDAEFDEYDTEDLEVVGRYRRFISRFLNIYAQAKYENERGGAAIGVSYILPFLIETSLDIDQRGDIEFSFSKALQLTSRLRSVFEAELNTQTPNEWNLELQYNFTWNFMLGVRVNQNGTLGIGFRLRR